MRRRCVIGMDGKKACEVQEETGGLICHSDADEKGASSSSDDKLSSSPRVIFQWDPVWTAASAAAEVSADSAEKHESTPFQTGARDHVRLHHRQQHQEEQHDLQEARNNNNSSSNHHTNVHEDDALSHLQVSRSLMRVQQAADHHHHCRRVWSAALLQRCHLQPSGVSSWRRSSNRVVSMRGAAAASARGVAGDTSSQPAAIRIESSNMATTTTTSTAANAPILSSSQTDRGGGSGVGSGVGSGRRQSRRLRCSRRRSSSLDCGLQQLQQHSVQLQDGSVGDDDRALALCSYLQALRGTAAEASLLQACLNAVEILPAEDVGRSGGDGEGDADPDPDPCSICLEPISSSCQRAARLRCSHRFHATCIRRWLASSNSSACPLCKGCVLHAAGTR